METRVAKKTSVAMEGFVVGGVVFVEAAVTCVMFVDVASVDATTVIGDDLVVGRESKGDLLNVFDAGGGGDGVEVLWKMLPRLEVRSATGVARRGRRERKVGWFVEKEGGGLE